MKDTAYDRDRAQRLVPLLQSILREIQERSREIERLQTGLHELRSDPRRKSSNAYLYAQAELALHRREARLARKELEQLGCEVDDDADCVSIPGDGDVRYHWRSGDAIVRQAAFAGPT